MRVRRLLPALILIALMLPLEARANNPIPGIPIIIKQCKCPPAWKCCSAVEARTAAGFFGPGSAAFDGAFGLMGHCSYDCGGCDNECVGSEANPDGRIDYAADDAAGPFEMIVAPTTLYSIEPIRVSINGVDSFFDVFVTVSGQGPQPDDPATGSVALPADESLDVGGASVAHESFLDLHTTMTFADAATGVAVGSAIEQDLHLVLQDAGVPITRVSDGTPGGHIVLGLGGSGLVPFTYASAGGEMSWMMRSLYPDAPVPARASTWGAVKTLYR